MKLRITIDCQNEAFADDGRGPELARCLRELADKLQGQGCVSAGRDWLIYDYNGNRVGVARTTR